MRVEQVKIKQLSELGDFVEKVEAEGYETVALAHSGAVLMQGSGETITTYTVMFRSLAVSLTQSPEQNSSTTSNGNTQITVEGLGVDREVEWFRDGDMTMRISLAELIATANREFTGVPLDQIMIEGNKDSDQMNISGESSEVRMQRRGRYSGEE
jgi:hypothetical protein